MDDCCNLSLIYKRYIKQDIDIVGVCFLGGIVVECSYCCESGLGFFDGVGCVIVFPLSLYFLAQWFWVFGNQMPSTRNQDTIVDGGTVVSNTGTIQ